MSAPNTSGNSARFAPFLVLLLCAAGLSAFTARAAAEHGAAPTPAGYAELFEISMKEKKGLTFFIEDQAIPGIVTKVNDDGTVEARSQTYSRIVIRIDSVDALALN
jgi:hypothetical protein